MIHTPFINGPILQLIPFNLAGLVMRFAINWRDHNRRVGILLITALDRESEHVSLELLISDPEKRALYGPEILQLALQVAFGEQKRRRVTVHVPEYDSVTIGLVEETGFVLEARQVQAIYLRGRFWDDLLFGLLETDWQVKVQCGTIPLPLEGYC
jgi:RimJ/RimL family protein N-acetyltransferase